MKEAKLEKSIQLEKLIQKTFQSPTSNNHSPEVSEFIRRLRETARLNGILVDLPPGDHGTGDTVGQETRGMAHRPER